MLSRRGFLFVGLAGASTVVAIRFGFSRPETVIAEVLARRLDYLKLEPLGVKAFARDLAAKNLVASTKLRVLSATGFMELPIEAVGLHVQTLRHGEERIVTYYLLSSDFFQNGADENRTVQYKGFYDPFLNNACMNPFTRAEASKEGEGFV